MSSSLGSGSRALTGSEEEGASLRGDPFFSASPVFPGACELSPAIGARTIDWLSEGDREGECAGVGGSYAVPAVLVPEGAVEEPDAAGGALGEGSDAGVGPLSDGAVSGLASCRDGMGARVTLEAGAAEAVGDELGECVDSRRAVASEPVGREGGFEPFPPQNRRQINTMTAMTQTVNRGRKGNRLPPPAFLFNPGFLDLVLPALLREFSFRAAAFCPLDVLLLLPETGFAVI
jgi:hypothetical protein